MHKIPVSIGLGTYLAKKDFGEEDKNQFFLCKKYYRYLMWFTLTSPIACFIVFFLFKAIFHPSKWKADDINNFNWWIAIIIILSAGTFLQVATAHILPSHSHGGDKEDH